MLPEFRYRSVRAFWGSRLLVKLTAAGEHCLMGVAANANHNANIKLLGCTHSAQFLLIAPASSYRRLCISIVQLQEASMELGCAIASRQWGRQ